MDSIPASLVTLAAGAVTIVFICVAVYFQRSAVTRPRDSREPLQILYDSTSAEVDIVAVHGLGSDVDWTWTHKSKDQLVHWLKDTNMLPDKVPRTRIIAYNYDSRWHSDAPRTRLRLCGQDLVHNLHEFRKNMANRPLVFIGHSLGGLVISYALLYAESRQEYHKLASYAVGFISLGTPFRGTGMQKIADWAAMFMILAGSHRSIIRDLAFDSEALWDNLQDFCRLRNRLRLRTCCFFEVYQTDYGARFKIPGLFRGMVVCEMSACIPGGENRKLYTDHLKLNKFKGPSDRSFLSVASQIQSMCDNWQHDIERRINIGQLAFDSDRLSQSVLECRPVQHFVAREQYNTKLEEVFGGSSPEGERRGFVLWGIPGSGKTQIALNFAHHVAKRLRVFWVRAENYATFVNSCSKILATLVTRDTMSSRESSQGDIVLEVCQHLQKTTDWLIILDNADDYDSFTSSPTNPQGIDRLLPTKGRFLVTTRDHRFQGTFVPARNGMEVEPMSIPEARELLARSLPEELYNTDEGDYAGSLITHLGSLPLAIAQAAVNIIDYRMSLKDFTLRYSVSELKARYLHAGVRDPHSDEARTFSVFDNWQLSLTHLQKTYPQSARLLQYLVTFHPTGIDETLVRLLPEFSNLDGIDVFDVVKRLLHRGLVSRTSNPTSSPEYNVHCLLHQWMIESTDTNTMNEMISTTVGLMVELFPVVSDYDYEIPVTDERRTGSYLLPHALHIIRLAQSKRAESLALARLAQVTAEYLKQGLSTAVAVHLAESSIRISAELRSPQNTDLDDLRRQTTLCACLEANGQFDDALSHLDTWRTSSAMIKAQNASSEGTVIAEENAFYELQARCFYRVGRLTESETLAETAIRHSVPQHSLWSAYWVHNHINWIRRTEGSVTSTGYGARLHDMFIDAGRRRSGNQMTRDELCLYMHSLTLRAHTLQAGNNASLYGFILQVFIRNFGYSDIDTWKAINNFCRAQSTAYPISAVQTYENFLMQTSNVVLVFNQQFRVTVSSTLFRLLDLKQHPNILRSTAATQWAGSVLNLLYIIFDKHDVAITDILDNQLNGYAVLLQRMGKFREAEILHKKALEQDTERLYVSQPQSWNIIHYNIMLAIARQPDRLQESHQYREEHLRYIEKAEEKLGSLDQRMLELENDLRLYLEAQKRKEENRLSLDDIWWKEHKTSLERAEGRLGPIFLVDTIPEEDENSDQMKEEIENLRLTYLADYDEGLLI